MYRDIVFSDRQDYVVKRLGECLDLFLLRLKKELTFEF
jgi:hypothetical protein